MNDPRRATLLEVNDVHATYGKFDVLRGISLNVDAGELIAVLGPNGAGKSTLLKTVAGFLAPRQGSIRFAGEEVSGFSPPRLLRKGIVYVMQRSSLFPKMTILENLELGAYVRKTTPEVRADIERVLALFPRLADRRHQRAEGLSGGERRMLEIGRALLVRPKLMLLDEPTMGLAPVVMDLIFEKILEVRAAGTTVVMVEQNARRALEVSDRAYVLEHGQTRVDGRGEELLASEAVRNAYLGSSALR
jgi:branched-chain amino acid transport system ATP-binding protein